MDLDKYTPLLREIIWADESPRNKLNDLLFKLTISERITFLKYILIEFEEGTIAQMIREREESECFPDFLYDKEYKEENGENLGMYDKFHIYLWEYYDDIALTCKKFIPERITSIEKSVKDIVERNKVLSSLLLEENGPIKDEESLDINEAAKFLGVRVKTMYKYNSENMINYHTVGGKLCRYYKSDLIKLRELKKKSK